MVRWILEVREIRGMGEERHKMHCPENQKESQIVTSFVVILP